MCRWSLPALLGLLLPLACSSSPPDTPTGACTDAADCADGQVCRESRCLDLTADEQQRLTAIATLYKQSRTQGAISVPVDYAALEANSRLELITGDGTPTSYVQTMWNALMALPQGHQGLRTDALTSIQDFLTSIPDLEAAMTIGFNVGALTLHQTCLSPYLDHAVVTIASAGTALHVGDEVVAIDSKRGAELQAFVIGQPDSGDLIPPSSTGRFAFAIRAFLGRDRNGMVFTVKRDGAEMDVTMTKGSALENAFSCLDPFSRDAYAPAIGSVLEDGTGVLYLPGFEQRSVADFESTVGPEFDKVKAAPRLVIDLRGNSGGILPAALDLVAQLPDAKKTSYCEFFNRDPDTEPATYTSATKTNAAATVDPTLVPAGNRFAYTGKVAILIDGATFSSGEHFILATRAAAHALVIGTKTAGAYGTTLRDTPTSLPGTPALQVTINESQVRTLDGKVLEGTSQEPDIVVEYEPTAIAAHQDPMMMRAVAELSK